mgnify:FL=1|jgi:hypothetical protein
MKKFYSPLVEDTFAAIGIIAGYYAIMALIAYIAW